VTYAVGSGPVSLAVADLNQDGVPDVAVANGGDASVTLYFGQSGTNPGDLGNPQTISLSAAGTGALGLNVVSQRTLDGNLQITSPQLLGATGARNIFAAVNGASGYVSPAGIHDLSSNIPAGQTSVMVVTGDFNGDGRGDDAVLTSDNQIIIEKGGAGSSSFFESFKPAVTALAIAAGDLNGDGRADLAIAGADGSIVVLIADANGSFKSATPMTLTPDFGAVNLVIGDATGDGINDIVLTTSTTIMTVFPGLGHGTFGTPIDLGLSDVPVGVPLIADFNRDKLPDLAVAVAGGYVNMLMGQGNEAFGDPFAIYAGGNPSAVAAGDFDQDGKLDLVVANQADNTISVLLNRTPSVLVGPSQITFLAVNGGPNPAPKAVQYGFDDPSAPAVTLTSDQKWLSAVTVQDSFTIVASADTTDLTGGSYTGHITVTADGHIQAVITVKLQLTTPAGTFSRGTTFTTSQGVGLAAADFNNDGKLDIIGAVSGATPCNCFEFIPGNNDGTFGTHIVTNFTVPFQPAHATVADFNGDGNLDVLFVDYQAGHAAVMFGKGDGHFTQSPIVYNIGANPVTTAAADFNRDGKTDVAILCTGSTVSGSTATSGEIWILINDGTGVFATSKLSGVGDHSMSMVVADFTNDGYDDLAVVNKGDQTLDIYLGLGNGTFLSPFVFPLPADLVPVGIAAGDFDNDGITDILLTGTSVTYVLLGNGGMNGPYPNSTPQALNIGDFDGDGFLDLALLLTQSSQNLQVGLGDQLGGFLLSPTSTNNFSTGGLPPSQVDQVVADFNGDGRLDLLTWDSQGAAIWYGSKAATSISAASTPPGSVASGANTTFTGTLGVVQPAWSQPASATGAITFNDVTNGTVAIATGFPTAGVFTSDNVALALGAHTIHAVFAGDARFAGSTSSDISLTVTGTAGPPASLTATGTPQGTIVSTPFAKPLSVAVRDANNNLLSGVSVTFTAPSSGASGVFSNGSNTITVASNALGMANATFTANATVGGPYTVTAAVGSVSASFSLTNIPAPVPGTLTPSGTPQSATIKTAYASPLSVTVRDTNNNLMVGVNITFTAPSSGASAVFSNGTNTITVATNANGVAKAAITANAIPGPYTVTATINSLTANFSLTNLAIFNATSIVASGTPQSATVNTAFASMLSVTLRDASRKPAPGINVTFTAPSPGTDVPSGLFASNTNTITVATNSSGVASVAFTANSKAGGPYLVAATAGPLVANFSLTNKPGAPANISITGGDNQSAPANRAFTTPLSVMVTDAYGNPVANTPVTMTAPSAGASGTFPGGGTTYTTNTNSQGIATATLTANSFLASFTVTATAAGKSVVFHLANSPLSQPSIHLNPAGNNQVLVVGTAAPTQFQVYLADNSGNPLNGVPVTFTSPAVGPSGTFGKSGHITNVMTQSVRGGVRRSGMAQTDSGAVATATGLATAPVFTANNVAGSYQVVASSLYGTVTFNVTNVPGPPTQIQILSGNNQAVTPGSPLSIPLTVQIGDFAGNPISGQTVIFNVTSVLGAGGSFSGNTAVVTDNKGTATAPPFTANSIAGSYTVTAHSGSLDTVFTLSNRTVAAVQVASGGGQGTAVGALFGQPLSVRVVDISNIPISGVPVAFTAPATGASAIFNSAGQTVIIIPTDAYGLATTATPRANAIAGLYTVTATAAGKSATFTLNNGGPPPVEASPSGLSFALTAGDPLPQPQTVILTGGNGKYSATSDSAWLTFTFADPSTLSVAADPTGLVAGTYLGNITITGTSGHIVLPVALILTGTPGVTVSPTSLTFAYTVGKANPADQTINLSSSLGAYSFAAAVKYVSPTTGTWLSMSTGGATATPATVRVSVNPTGLKTGTYQGTIHITTPDLPDFVLDVPVNLVVANPLSSGPISVTAIVNGASTQFGPVAPGEIVTLYGGNVTCNGTPIVQEDGVAVQVLSAKNDQINFIIPDAASTKTRSSVQVNCGLVSSGLFTVSVAATAPGIYTNMNGAATATNQDGKTANSAAQPAARGSMITLYGTGFGGYKLPDGRGLRAVVAPVVVTIGGQPAQVQFAGASPGQPGVVQINALIPSSLQTTGAIPVQVTAGTGLAQPGITIYVK
jgi:uncharacterized protein (TIGR03437 family)